MSGSSERSRRIVEAYRAGERARHIADREGVSVPWVYQLARKYGAARGPSTEQRAQWRAAAAERRERVAAAYRAGETSAAIAAREGVSVSSIEHDLDAASAWRRPDVRTSERRARVAALYRAGARIGEIAAEERVHYRTIYTDLVALELKIVRRRGRFDAAEARRLRRAGAVLESIALHMNVSLGAVEKACQGVPRGDGAGLSRALRLTPKQIAREARDARIVAAFRAGWSTRDIGEAEDLTRHAVRRILGLHAVALGRLRRAAPTKRSLKDGVAASAVEMAEVE